MFLISILAAAAATATTPFPTPQVYLNSLDAAGLSSGIVQVSGQPCQGSGENFQYSLPFSGAKDKVDALTKVRPQIAQLNGAWMKAVASCGQ